MKYHNTKWPIKMEEGRRKKQSKCNNKKSTNMVNSNLTMLAVTLNVNNPYAPV